MEAGDWRSELSPRNRQNAINIIFHAIKQKLPPSSLQELQEIAVRVEEMIYTKSKSKVEYGVGVKSMLDTQNFSCSTEIPTDSGSQSNQSQAPELEQSTSFLSHKHPQTVFRQQQQPQQAPFFHPNPSPTAEQLLQLQHQEQLKRQKLSLSLFDGDSMGTLNTSSDTRHLEAYHKDIRSKYLKELKEMYQKTSNVLQQNSSGAQEIKLRLGHAINELNDPKSKIDVGKLDLLKKTINCTLQRVMSENLVSSQLHGQFSSSMHPGQKLLHSQSQTPIMTPPEDHRNPQLQSMNTRSSLIMPQTICLDDSEPSSFRPATQQLKNMNLQQYVTKPDSYLGNSAKSVQQVYMGSLQIPICALEQSISSNLATQSHGNVPEPNANSFLSSSITPERLNQMRTMEERHAPVHKLKQNFQQHQLGRQFILRKQEIPQLQQQLQGIADHLPQHSHLTDQHNLLKLHTNVGFSSCSASIPSSTLDSPLKPGFSEKLFANSSSFSNAGEIKHQQTTDSLEPDKAPEMSSSPLPPKSKNLDCVNNNAFNATFGDRSDAEGPVDRLIKVVRLMSERALEASVTEIASVVCLTDRMAGSASVCGSKGLVGEDLTRRPNKLRMMKMKRSMFAAPSNVVSSAGMEKSDLESATISRIKRPRIEVNHALLEEISKINKCLIDTVVDISDENTNSTIKDGTGGTEGTIVKCSFSAVTVIPKPCAQFPLIQPLQLLVPTNYPNCSPILLDKLPLQVSEENEDLSLKAKTKLSMSLRDLSEPMSVEQIAKTWDICIRAVLSEYALQNGGGSFSSKYGTWEQCFTDS